MPSPSVHKKSAHRTAAAPRRGAGSSASSLANPRTGDGDDAPPVARRRRPAPTIHAIGKRTGVTLPPRGDLPFDDDGLENADAFFAAARSPTSPEPSPGRAYGRRAEKARERERREEEKRRRRRELEEEGRRNASRRPDLLNHRGDSEAEEDGAAGRPGAERHPQPTPKQPEWTNRLLHQAMGVPTEDSPAYTVLSRVSTAAPSTRGSVDTIATESRHGLRAEQSGAQLDRLVRHEEEEGGAEASPPAAAAVAVAAAADAPEEDGEEGGPMDPPEEMSQDSFGNGEKKRGVDPEERDHLLEPEDNEETEEEVAENLEGNVSANKSARELTKLDENVPAKKSGREAMKLDDNVSAKESAKSDASGVFDNATAKSASSSMLGDDVSAKPSAKSAKSGATDPLEGSLEEVLHNPKYAKYNQDYNDDFDGDDNEGEGGMQLAAQPGDGFDDNDDVDFGNDSGGGFDDGGDDGEDLDDGDEMSRQAIQEYRKSHGSHTSDKSESRQSHKSDRSESLKSHASSHKSNNNKSHASSHRSNNSKSHASSHRSNNSKSHASSFKSDRSEKSQMSMERPPSPEDDDEDDEEEERPYRVPAEDPLRKKKSQKDKFAKKPAPATPTSVLQTKKSKKKKQTANRVNWSTPNGRSTGIPMANRDYEARPVSEYKEDYPDEPRTPGGSALRRSRRLQKLIYEAQNERGLLGEAMGDMPVVVGVVTALPTPYKAVKKREPKEKKKRRRGSDDEDSDDDTKRARSPFDDKALCKKYRIRNGESGSVWSETLESSTDIKIVSRLDRRSFSKLPLSSARKQRESKVVGFASQAFHVPTDADDLFPGYIAGNVVLPPRGIKDAEGVGLCSTVFNIGDCQPNSLEFAIADPKGQDGEFDPKTAQRYLLSKGDIFQIPPGNVYRIENHSRVEKANLFWTIIKCTSRAEQEDSGEEEEGEED